MCETEKMITVRVELPGIGADHIKIGLTSTKLRIWGEKKKDASRNRFASML